MAFDHDAKLFDVLANGYHLSTQLQALLGCPLDSLGQQEALAISQELSRVFKVSMSMLNSNTMTRVRTAQEIRTGNSSGVIIQAEKDKRARYYFRCGRDRRCEAKKKVQQQDGSPGRGQLLPPMFEVIYVNEHTCHVLRAIANRDAATAKMASPRTTNRYHRALGVVDTARDDGGGGVLFDDLSSSSSPRIGGGGGGGSAQENETIVSCLADVIRGAVPSPSPSPSLWPPAAEAGASSPASAWYVPLPMQASSGRSASVAEDGGALMMKMIDDTDTDFSWDPSSFCAVGEARQLMDHRDMHVDAARFADTVWPRHTSAGAWS